MTDINYIAECDCGQVRFEASANPACNVTCYCEDCQSAAKTLVKERGCENLLEADGGTSFSIFLEKDWTCVAGAERIEGHKLKADSPTTRYVSSCCQTPLYLKFGPGFWISSFRTAFKSDIPNLQWRIKTSHRTSSLPYPDTLPRFKGFPLRLYWALYRAKWRK